MNRTINRGIGDYVYDESLGSPYYHYRNVNWIAIDIPRDRFDQDILYSLGAFMTVCKIHRNNAEEEKKTFTFITNIKVTNRNARKLIHAGRHVTEESYTTLKKKIANMDTMVTPVNHYELVFNEQPEIYDRIHSFLA